MLCCLLGALLLGTPVFWWRTRCALDCPIRRRRRGIGLGLTLGLLAATTGAAAYAFSALPAGGTSGGAASLAGLIASIEAQALCRAGRPAQP